MLMPEVVGFKLHGTLREGATATDLVLTVTEMLRKKRRRRASSSSSTAPASRRCRSPIARRSATWRRSTARPSASSRCDAETLATCASPAGPEPLVELVEAYAKEQGIFRTDDTPEPIFTDTLELDLGDVEPSIAGPKRPQDRVR